MRAARLSFPPLSAVPGIALLAAVVTTGTLGACREEPPGFCPKDMEPATCPSPAPSYAMDVAPIIRSRCSGCHGPGGLNEFLPFQTYDQVQAQQMGIKAVLVACMMPPADQPQLTSAQWLAILGWIACGATNN